MWKQLNLDYLKGSVKAVQVSLVGGIVKLASGVARFGLWAEGESRRIKDAMKKDQVAILEWCFKGFMQMRDVHNERRLENFLF